MAISGTLEVTPQKLISTASSFQSQGNRVRSYTGQMLQLVNKFNGVWEGSAQQVYASRLRMLDNDIATIIKKINEHVTDLQEMASKYMTAESRNTSVASKLRGDYVQN